MKESLAFLPTTDSSSAFGKEPTLELWIFGHKQKPPSQRSGRGVSAPRKQIHGCVQKVFFVEVAVADPRFLWETEESLRLFFHGGGGGTG